MTTSPRFTHRPDLAVIATEIRRICLEITFERKAGHLGSDFSSADILAVLFGDVLKFAPHSDAKNERDRFILSKGHAALAYYAALAICGHLEKEALADFSKFNSRLPGHPSNVRLPLVETSTGALGHGLPFAVGAALAAKMDESARRTYVLLGDGELQEGSNWEAAMLASHHGLDNLVAIVDRNGLQQGRPTETVNSLEPLVNKWEAFGWSAAEIDGHCVTEIRKVISQAPMRAGRPTCLIARTIKGRGVSFMEGNVAWHHRVPNSKEYQSAMSELEFRGIDAEHA